MTGDLFRLVNDRIHDLGPPSLAEFDFVCERAHEGCTNAIRMTEPEYEAARADTAQFVVLPGNDRRSRDRCPHRRLRAGEEAPRHRQRCERSVMAKHIQKVFAVRASV